MADDLRSSNLRLARYNMYADDGPGVHESVERNGMWVRYTDAAQEIERMRRLQISLFSAIEHGEAKHRAWLKQAIDDHFAGRPVLRPDRVTDETSRCSHDWGLSGAGVKTCRRCGAEQTSVT